MKKKLILCGIPLFVLAAFIFFSKISHGDNGHIEVQSTGAEEISRFVCVNGTNPQSPDIHLAVDERNKTMSVNFEALLNDPSCAHPLTGESVPALFSNGEVIVELTYPPEENCFMGTFYFRIILQRQRRSAVSFITENKRWDEVSEQEKIEAQANAFHYSCYPEGNVIR